MAIAANVARYEELEEQQRIQEVAAHPKMVVIKRSQAPAALKAIIVIAVSTVLLAMCLASKAEIASIHAEIITEKENLENLRKENTRMAAAIEEKSSNKAVEEYAEKVLGMQKLERAQTEYITIDGGNVVEVNETEDSFAKRFAYEFEKFTEKLRDKQEEKNK